MKTATINHECAALHELSLREAYVLALFRQAPEKHFSAEEVGNAMPLVAELGNKTITGLCEALEKYGLLTVRTGAERRWIFNDKTEG